MNVDEVALTRLLVYGTENPQSDPNTHIRAENAPAPIKTFSMSEYLTTGAGRYARPSEVPLIASFFADRTGAQSLSDNTYSIGELRIALGLSVSGAGSQQFSVSNYVTDAGSSDFIERAYVFGGSPFSISNGAKFVVSAGSYSITGVELIAENDDFDFQSSSLIGSSANILLAKALDPYDLIPKLGADTTGVILSYVGSGRQYGIYTEADFQGDQAFVSANSTPALAAVKLAAAVAGLATGTGYLGGINSDEYFEYYAADGKKLVYGTSDPDSITVLSAEVTADIYFGFKMVGGDGGDQLLGSLLFGDDLYGGAGQDTLSGLGGDDIIIGGPGNDAISGGAGTDISRYRGNFSDYKIEFQANGNVSVSDAVTGRDGADVLTSTEYAEFADQKAFIGSGQDLAFVIDTTGSMSDDIGAVKANAGTIINAIFDPTKGLLNSRVAVVGYNDPTTQTILSFTDQADPTLRKSAALGAINSISVGGGGDEPELTYTGLLRALDGRAGEWRDDAAARRILLFGDASPKDANLASKVFALAKDVNATISGFRTSSEVVQTSVAKGVDMTTFVMSGAETAEGIIAPVPVQIFTIAIGNYQPAIRDFRSIADSTDGQAFGAANASQVVGAILKVINLPIYSITTPIASLKEGDLGEQAVSFLISRTVGTATATVDLSLKGTVDAMDLSGFPGSVTFGVGETQKVITLQVRGDTDVEDDESIVMNIDRVSEDSTRGVSTASVLVVNDDVLNQIVGSQGSDYLVGSDGTDVIKGLGGAYDNMHGGKGNDIFVFGQETRNGVRERDVIGDFEPGLDVILLEDGASVSATRKSSSGLILFLNGDGDAIYVNGIGLTPENVTILPRDSDFIF